MEKSFFLSIPKVELHNHLEGTIDPKTFQVLVKKHESENVLAQSIDECLKLYQFDDFTGFLVAFSKVSKFIREPSDLAIILQNSVSKLKQEHYYYVEYFISLDSFLLKGMSLIEILDILKTLRHNLSTSNFVIGGFIIDLVRNYGPNSASLFMNQLLPILESYRDIILGISIGGDEVHFPSPAFKGVFERARSAGLKTTAHAGESAGPESIWETIFNLKTDRIGHGLRINDSMELFNHFRVTQTPIEVCPTSNVKTGLINSIQVHPVSKFLQHGLNVSINTDDAGFFNTTLTNEFEHCVSFLGFDSSDLKQCLLNAIQDCFYDSFLKKELKEKLQLQLDRYFS